MVESTVGGALPLAHADACASRHTAVRQRAAANNNGAADEHRSQPAQRYRALAQRSTSRARWPSASARALVRSCSADRIRQRATSKHNNGAADEHCSQPARRYRAPAQPRPTSRARWPSASARALVRSFVSVDRPSVRSFVVRSSSRNYLRVWRIPRHTHPRNTAAPARLPPAPAAALCTPRRVYGQRFHPTHQPIRSFVRSFEPANHARVWRTAPHAPAWP